jgi:hypothetical protein
MNLEEIEICERTDRKFTIIPLKIFLKICGEREIRKSNIRGAYDQSMLHACVQMLQ